MSDDSAYERVTDRERFAVLHQVAADLVADLSQHFDVTVEPVEPEGEGLTGGTISAMRVSPNNDGAAITLTLTGFPGLFLRFGTEHTEGFPQCGCDACDEQPDQLADDLREKVRCVSQGRFSEPPGGHRFSFDDGRESSGSAVRHAGTRSGARPYEPWPRRRTHPPRGALEA